jgi:AraC-like DNA-binding protein
MRGVMEYIADNAHKKLNVEGLAKRAAMSASHFAHRFREITSVSPMRYQKHVRMERARELLLADGMRSGSIAERVGYLSEAQFTRDFKRHFGLAPSLYARTFARDATALVRAMPSPASAVEARGSAREQDADAFAGSSKKKTGPALVAARAAL